MHANGLKILSMTATGDCGQKSVAQRTAVTAVGEDWRIQPARDLHAHRSRPFDHPHLKKGCQTKQPQRQEPSEKHSAHHVHAAQPVSGPRKARRCTFMSVRSMAAMLKSSSPPPAPVTAAEGAVGTPSRGARSPPSLSPSAPLPGPAPPAPPLRSSVL